MDRATIIAALEGAGNDGSAMVKALTEMGFKHTYAYLGSEIVWEHPLVKAHNAKAHILRNHSCTLYELIASDGTWTLWRFCIGRIGNDSNYEFRVG